MRPYELFIGLRYTRAKRRNHFISFISGISILGITLGVTALIVVLSVMNGFQKEVRARILGITPHLQVSSFDGPLSDWQPILKIVSRNNGVSAAAPYVSGEAMLSLDNNVQGVTVRGITPKAEDRLTHLSGKMTKGSLFNLKPGEFGIVLGADLALALGAHVGDKVLMITPQGQVTPAGMLPRLKQFTVVGTFKIGMYPYDNVLALINLNDAQTLFHLDGAVTGISAHLRDLDKTQEVSAALEKSLKKTRRDLAVNDWTKQNANYFRAVQMEKRVMFIILSLIVAVAAFNIVSTLVMVVTDKQADIAILRTQGASPLSIMKIFMVQGVVIGLVGTLLGVACGVILSLNIETIVPFIEHTFHMRFFPPDVYYISEVPSDLHETDVLTVAYFSFLISLLATLYPSWRASKTQPAEALRYE